MEAIIRSAELKDVDRILEIINHEIKYTTVVYDYNERTYEQQKLWLDQKQMSKMPVIVAELDGLVVGYGSYGIFRPWDAYRYSVEHSIYVDAAYRQAGIGKKMLETLITFAKEGGYHTMIAGVDASNEKSIAFHKKMGFLEVGTLKEAGYKFDKWLDLTFLQLFL
ncbi:MAG: N-acetyltransferase family protein [Saprospiraceae bacterium]